MRPQQGVLQQFYRRLLRRRPPEIIIVILFLGFVLIFQMTAPSMFRGFSDENDITVTKLSHKEALWEIMYLQEQLKRSHADVASLKEHVEKLTAEAEIPKNTRNHIQYSLSSTLLNTISFQTFDRHGIYTANALHDEPGRTDSGNPDEGLQAALLNYFGKYICEQYNINPKGGMFRKVFHGKVEKGNMTDRHFQTGIYRYIPQTGTEYHLYFRDPSPSDIEDHYLYRININRYFEHPQSFTVEHINSVSKKINIIVPLKGRLQVFKQFLLNLVQIKAATDFYLHLTVVFFGSQGVQKVHQLMDTAKRLGFGNIHFVNILQEQFARGAAMQKGVESLKEGNDLMFLCDVDVIIKKEFFERCVSFTDRGRSVYFPIVFSLFNPDIVSFFVNDTANNQTLDDHFSISRHRGFWRDFGFGMLCTHKSDYFKVGGYRQWNRKDADPRWGYEDVDLFKRFTKQPGLRVIRAPDPSIVHKWHPKTCPDGLSPQMLKQCQTSMIATEGNFEQLGRLHFNTIHKEFRQANKSLSFS